MFEVFYLKYCFFIDTFLFKDIFMEQYFSYFNVPGCLPYVLNNSPGHRPSTTLTDNTEY